MLASAIDIRRFLHRFALRAAILSRLHLTGTCRMFAFLAVCHVVSPLISKMTSGKDFFGALEINRPIS
jgi:hypothetical protein